MKPGRPPRRRGGGVPYRSLTGSDEVLDAAFRASGPTRRADLGPLLLRRGPRQAAPPRGPRLTVLSNAGGPGVLATDTLIGGGGKLAELAPDTMAALDAVLPPTWSHGNPVDIIGDAPPERYAAALEVVTRDPGSDGLLVILTPQAMTDPTRTAQQLVPYASRPASRCSRAGWAGSRSRPATASCARRGRDLPVPRQRGPPVHAARPLRRGPEVPLRDPGVPGRARGRAERDRAGPSSTRLGPAAGRRCQSPSRRLSSSRTASRSVETRAATSAGGRRGGGGDRPPSSSSS